MSKQTGGGLQRALWLLALACVSLILLLNLFYHSEVSYTFEEKVTISGHIFRSIAMLLPLTAGIVVLARFRKQLERLNQSVVFGLFSAVYVLIAAYLIANNNHVLRADPSFVYHAASQARQGVYAEFQPGGYIHTYPHQLGLLLYDMLLMGIAETPIVNFVMNTVWVLGIQFVCWQLSRLLSEDRLVHLMTICLSFAFFPQLLFVLFAYGQIPGLFFLITAFYFTLHFCRTGSWKSGFAIPLCTALSILLRNNNLIGAIAIICYLLLHFLKERGWKKAIAAALVAVCMMVPGRLVTAAFEAKSGAELDNGVPSILWLAMGTDIDNRDSGPGWYDVSSYRIYREAGWQAEAAKAVGEEKLRANMEKIRQSPPKAAAFFRDKVISVWCDPLYESVWSGPMELYGQIATTPLLLSLYGGGKAEDLAEMLAKALSLVVWIGVCVYLLCHGKKQCGWELALLYFMGGLAFHLFWEAKSQYVYPYVFCLIPFAAHGLADIMKTVEKKMRRS